MKPQRVREHPGSRLARCEHDLGGFHVICGSPLLLSIGERCVMVICTAVPAHSSLRPVLPEAIRYYEPHDDITSEGV